jgi:hypothetical protein
MGKIAHVLYRLRQDDGDLAHPTGPEGGECFEERFCNWRQHLFSFRRRGRRRNRRIQADQSTW